MASSNSHKFGQIIGDALEMAVEPFLRGFASEHNLYLDVKGPRTARPGSKVTWIDINGNKHDLDFVLEKSGSESSIGTPVAFIECAWRRYTKHSKNKAQEIQGAIIPLFDKYKSDHPFTGVILAGEFTDNSLIQLKSLGFSILFFPYEIIIKAFKKADIEAFFDENTKETHFATQIEKWENLSNSKKANVYKAIADLRLNEINEFISALKIKIKRSISIIRLWTMYGKQFDFKSIDKAKEFIVSYDPKNIMPEFDSYVAEVEYSNGDLIKINYKKKEDMLAFLTHFV